MRGHSWEKLPTAVVESWPGPALRESLPHLYNDVEPQYSHRRRWRCRRCHVLLEAVGEEKQCAARRRSKIPHDCDLTIVRSVLQS